MKIINTMLFAWLDGIKAKIFKQKLKERNKKKDKVQCSFTLFLVKIDVLLNR